jgi:hypothetical protein
MPKRFKVPQIRFLATQAFLVLAYNCPTSEGGNCPRVMMHSTPDFNYMVIALELLILWATLAKSGELE